MAEARPGQEVHETAHEPRDWSLKVVIGFAVGLLAVLSLFSLILAAFFASFSTNQAQSRELPSMVTVQAPPQPALEVPEGDALAKLRQYEDKQLTTYGWVDRQKGIVHIPINQAMDALLKQGLPTRSSGSQGSRGSPNAKPVLTF